MAIKPASPKLAAKKSRAKGRDKPLGKGRGGRPQHDPTAQQRQAVRILKAGGADHATIAGVLKISIDTIERYYREELDDGAAVITAAIASKLIAGALGGDKILQMFYLKCRAGWKEGRSFEDVPDPQKPALLTGGTGGRVLVFIPDNGRGDATIVQDA